MPALLLLLALLVHSPVHRTVLTIDGSRFSLNGKPTFLLGISLYGALGESDDNLRRDIADLRRHGFNWIRVWATWAAFDNDISAVDPGGNPREPYIGKLARLVEACDRAGIVVDVTLSRGDGTRASPHLMGLEAHRNAAETLAAALKPFRNWYLDLSNERNVRDKRYTSMEDLSVLRDAVKRIDPNRLVTASHGGDIDEDSLRGYLTVARLDFVCPHRPRDPHSPAQTDGRTRDMLAAMAKIGRTVPVDYQEPLRRGYNDWQPARDDFLTDLRGALAGGAAGWCLHNGAQQGAPDSRPRRSFDLRDGRLFDQLDDVERSVVAAARHIVDKAMIR